MYDPRSMRSSICTGVRPGTLDSHSCRRTSRECHQPWQDKQLCIGVASHTGPKVFMLATKHCKQRILHSVGFCISQQQDIQRQVAHVRPDLLKCIPMETHTESGKDVR